MYSKFHTIYTYNTKSVIL